MLDFGCGWGRVARFFYREVELYGVDISKVGVGFCQASFGPERFSLIEPWPPTHLPADSFDLVYAISVFSHLPERLHLAWLAEIERLLVPGGILFATTLRRDSLDPVRLMEDLDAAVAAYDAGEFVFRPIPREQYGLTMIPESYARREWAPWLTVRQFISDRGVFPQNVIVAQKALT